MRFKHIFNGLKRLSYLPVILLLLSPVPARAQSVTVDRGEEVKNRWVVLPYALYTANTELTFGVMTALTGYLRKQTALGATVLGSTNGTLAGHFLGRDIPLLIDRRLALDTGIGGGKYGRAVLYQNGNPDYPDEQAGSNDSSQENYLEGKRKDGYVWMRFSYLFPFGNAEDIVVSQYVVDEGILVSGQSGGETWNPLESGLTYLEFTPFYRNMKFTSDIVDNTLRTNGTKFTLLYDNTDFPTNPSRGSSQRFTIARDWGGFASTASWTVIDAEVSKYFSLGASDSFRQRVIALNFWTANTSTFDSFDTEDGEPAYHRPPTFMGATLGGMWRMRAYPRGRFQDQAAIYYTAEYRMIPDWNPLADISWLEFLDVAWIQFVPFAEVGRVAEKWTVKELHRSMKWDVGLGIRMMFKHMVARIDTAYSGEGLGLTVMVQQPF